MKHVAYIFFSATLMVLASLLSVAMADEEKQAVELFDTERNLYNVQINEHGAILKSEEAGETLFIGRDCDVVSPKHGKGKWLSSEMGILVTFSERRFVFGRQTLELDNNNKCKMAL